ncbi:MAG TPA: hypothetical protein VM406_04915, partial [Noviherbaspirillum sp.]|nr:hypothetical protein [Noviherbaspirillum sp.]
MDALPVFATACRALALYLALSLTASAQEQQPTPGAIASLEAAEQALEMVGAERGRIEAQFAEEEYACHARFFVSRCLDEAHERRRQALAPLN